MDTKSQRQLIEKFLTFMHIFVTKRLISVICNTKIWVLLPLNAVRHVFI